MLKISVSKHSDEVKAVYEKAKKWIDTWINDINHEYQLKHSMQMFENFIARNEKKHGTVILPLKEHYSSLKNIMSRIALAYKGDKMDLGHMTSSIGESSNKSMKYFNILSMSCMGIAKAGKKMAHNVST